MGIKEQRLRKKLSQEQLAEIIGVDRTTISKWESGYCFPRVKHLKLMANVLKCSVGKLLE